MKTKILKLLSPEHIATLKEFNCLNQFLNNTAKALSDNINRPTDELIAKLMKTLNDVKFPVMIQGAFSWRNSIEGVKYWRAIQLDYNIQNQIIGDTISKIHSA
jgi:hypothetical protein